MSAQLKKTKKNKNERKERHNFKFMHGVTFCHWNNNTNFNDFLEKKKTTKNKKK